MFINASKEFIKVGNSNKLTSENIQAILDAYIEKKRKSIFQEMSHIEIVKKDYDLSVNFYIEPEDTREKIDIIKLNKEIRQIVTKSNVLRQEIDKIVKEIDPYIEQQEGVGE